MLQARINQERLLSKSRARFIWKYKTVLKIRMRQFFFLNQVVFIRYNLPTEQKLLSFVY